MDARICSANFDHMLPQHAHTLCTIYSIYIKRKNCQRTGRTHMQHVHIADIPFSQVDYVPKQKSRLYSLFMIRSSKIFYFLISIQHNSPFLHFYKRKTFSFLFFSPHVFSLPLSLLRFKNIVRFSHFFSHIYYSGSFHKVLCSFLNVYEF